MTLQNEIIKELGVKPVIDPKEEIRVSVDFLKDYLKKYPFIKSFYILNFLFLFPKIIKNANW